MSLQKTPPTDKEVKVARAGACIMAILIQTLVDPEFKKNLADNRTQELTQVPAWNFLAANFPNKLSSVRSLAEKADTMTVKELPVSIESVLGLPLIFLFGILPVGPPVDAGAPPPEKRQSQEKKQARKK